MRLEGPIIGKKEVFIYIIKRVVVIFLVVLGLTIWSNL